MSCNCCVEAVPGEQCKQCGTLQKDGLLVLHADKDMGLPVSGDELLLEDETGVALVERSSLTADELRWALDSHYRRLAKGDRCAYLLSYMRLASAAADIALPILEHNAVLVERIAGEIDRLNVTFGAAVTLETRKALASKILDALRDAMPGGDSE